MEYISSHNIRADVETQPPQLHNFSRPSHPYIFTCLLAKAQQGSAIHVFLVYGLGMVIYRCKMFHFQCIQGSICSYKIHQCYYKKHWHHSYGRSSYTR